jgi:hypothetical protein
LHPLQDMANVRALPIDREDWQQTFARAAAFSLALLACIFPVRLSGAISAGPILSCVQNWSLAVLCSAAAIFGWGAAVRGYVFPRGFDWNYARATAILFGITLAALSTIVLLRSAAAETDAPYLRLLDMAGGLVLPMASGVALIMLPYISLRGIRRTARVLSACCLLASLFFTTQLLRAHNAPKAEPHGSHRVHGLSVA